MFPLFADKGYGYFPHMASTMVLLRSHGGDFFGYAVWTLSGRTRPELRSRTMRCLVAALVLCGAVPSAFANGRAPGTSTINFEQGNEQRIAAGMTFGLLLSEDGGASWRWMCEAAVKYGGQYDPDYAYTSSNALFATTFDGSLVNRNGCEFELTPHGNKFVSAVSQGPDGALYTALAQPANPTVNDPGDSAIYKSTDNGLTFPTSAAPGQVNDWWNSVEVAPSDPNRVYLSGYRLMPPGRTFLVFRSDNGATSWTPIQTTGITTTDNSTIDIVGISRTNPDHVYARVSFQDPNEFSDAIFGSVDGGMSWTLLKSVRDMVSFVVRANGDLVIGTQNAGSFVSRAPSNGAAWEALPSAPHINCLVENAAGEVWACTQNYGGTIPGDGAGIMKTTDLVTWSAVLRYEDIQSPVTCDGSTIQKSMCEPLWCGLRMQLKIASTVIGCPAELLDGTATKSSGCCDTGNNTSAPVLLGFGALVAATLLKRRRP